MFFISMAKMVLKSVISKPATRLYPFIARTYNAPTRGSIDININECIFCMLCQKKCPTQAITVDRENKTWNIDRLRCIQCGYCVEVCPKKCLSMNPKYSESVFFKK